MKHFLAILIMPFIFWGCASTEVKPPLIEHKELKSQKISEYETIPPLLEILTVGIYTHKEDVIKAERKAQYKEKYVTDINDNRGAFRKLLSSLTFDLFGRRETKKSRQKRLILEDQRKAQLEQQILEEKSMDISRFGTIAQEKQKYSYKKGAVMATPKLGQLQYGISTFTEVVNILGQPIKVVKQRNRSKEALFKVYAETYKYLPYIGTPQKDIVLSFNTEGILLKPEVDTSAKTVADTK